MNDFVTIATFTYPSELVVIKGKLEFEGVECLVKDELTAQVHNFLSNAIGGIKLQVKRKDATRAIQILEEAGYLKKDHERLGKFWRRYNELGERIPLFNKLAVELRLIIVLAVLLSVIIFGVLALLEPSTHDYLTQNSWCVQHVTYNETDYMTETYGLTFQGVGFCDERIFFQSNGELALPGFKSLSIHGYWSLEDGNLVISQTDTLQFIYEGTYALEKSTNGLKLTSERTTLHCYQSKWRWEFPTR